MTGDNYNALQETKPNNLVQIHDLGESKQFTETVDSLELLKDSSNSESGLTVVEKNEMEIEKEISIVDQKAGLLQKSYEPPQRSNIVSYQIPESLVENHVAADNGIDNIGGFAVTNQLSLNDSQTPNLLRYNG